MNGLYGVKTTMKRIYYLLFSFLFPLVHSSNNFKGCFRYYSVTAFMTAQSKQFPLIKLPLAPFQQWHRDVGLDEGSDNEEDPFPNQETLCFSDNTFYLLSWGRG